MKKLILIATFAVAVAAYGQKSNQSDTVTVASASKTNKVIRSIPSPAEQVNVEQMKKSMQTSSLDALSGQVAGVQVQTTNNHEVMVNAVRVRGTTSLTGGNDPLVIIDGVASDLATLSTIYPPDIESITVLKNASETSQYGSRGAAGVIEVTTKKGKSGRFHISYDGIFGIEAKHKWLNMLNANEFRQAAQQMNVSIIDRGYDTDFIEAITRTGFSHNHHVSFGGGSENSNYRCSLGMRNHKTIIRNNDLRTYIAKLDITQRAFDERVTFDIGVFGNIQYADLLPARQKLLYSAAAFNPTFPEGKNEKGQYENITESNWISNPNNVVNMEDDDETSALNAHIRAKANLGYDMNLTALASYTYTSFDRAHYYNKEAYRADAKKTEILGNIAIEKIFKFPTSQLNLTAMGEILYVKSKGFHVTATGFTTDAFGYDNLAAGALRPWEGTGSFYSDSHLGSFLFKANYSLQQRYSLTLSARTDGSSKVGKNNRWGFFPSVSGSWLIWDKELDGSQQSFVNYIKLRMGYGLSGNLGGIDAYNSMQLVAPNGVINTGGKTITALSVIRNANPDLKWEVKHTFNVGLNAAFWDKRIILYMDYYYSRITDMLYMYDVPVPPFTYDKMLANLGVMRNSGFEIGFGIIPFKRSDSELSFGMNLSFERNKLISLDGDYNGQHLTAPAIKGIAGLSGAGFHGGSTAVYQIVGEPLGVFYLPHCNGLVTDPDGSKRYDVTKEKYICGQAMPNARLGINISYRYKQWDIAMQANGAFGHHIFNGTALSYNNMLSLPNYNVMQGAPEQNIQDQTISDYWLERGDYLNIDYVTIGWLIPIKSRHIQQMRLSASVNNLHTFTGYSGLTPLINSSVVNNTLGIDDKRSLPVYRTYSLGISVQF